MILAKRTNKNNALQKIVRQKFYLIDSEVLREPFSRKYNHAQDQRITKKAEKLDLIKDLQEFNLYCFVDYSTLPKCTLFTRTQAQYGSQFLLNMFVVLRGCFFVEKFSEKISENAENNKTILYSKVSTENKNTNQRKTEDNRVRITLSANNQDEIILQTKQKNISQMAQITNYFNSMSPDHSPIEIEIISNNPDMKIVATEHYLNYRSGESWLKSVCKHDYG